MARRSLAGGETMERSVVQDPGIVLDQVPIGAPPSTSLPTREERERDITAERAAEQAQLDAEANRPFDPGIIIAPPKAPLGPTQPIEVLRAEVAELRAVLDLIVTHLGIEGA